VSRSFYLTLRWLPRAVRPQISVAYLLARTTDTIADTDVVSVEQRVNALETLRERILGDRVQPVQLAALGQQHSSSPEGHLLERVEEAIFLLSIFSAQDRRFIREVLQTIIGGQLLDLRRFCGAFRQDIRALKTEEEVEDYTYRVAGCVGEFWTRICRAHLFPAAPLDEARLFADAVRFGKGLQLVNLLRDLPSDLRQGRCYLPAESLSELGLKPADLLDQTIEPKLRPLVERWLSRAEDYLRDGWRYTNALPRSCVRVRLVCAWPILIGLKTIVRLRNQHILDSSQRIRISRQEVRGLLLRSVVTYPWPGAWNRLYLRALSLEDRPIGSHKPRHTVP
jgi:farnesyl-diphosphate farnesyltransferase